MLGNPIQVVSNHIVCVGDICVLCGCSINGSLALQRMCSTFLLSIDQASDKGLHIVYVTKVYYLTHVEQVQ
jgi:hypothetical protein